jgi:hypothetical protein
MTDRRKQLPRVTEPDENLVHFCAPFGMDQITLCGLTDWLQSKKRGRPTRAPVTCQPCRWIVDYVGQHRPSVDADFATKVVRNG